MGSRKIFGKKPMTKIMAIMGETAMISRTFMSVSFSFLGLLSGPKNIF